MSEGDPELQQLSRLLALSSSSNEHEARTAAKKACDLIAEHDLVVIRRDDLDVAKALREACEGCVLVARDEYERIVGEIGKLAAAVPSRGGRGKTLAERLAGDLAAAVVRGVTRRL